MGAAVFLSRGGQALHYGLVVLATALLLSSCRSAPKQPKPSPAGNAGPTATAPRDPEPADAQTSLRPGPATRDSTAASERQRPPRRVATKPTPNRSPKSTNPSPKPPAAKPGVIRAPLPPRLDGSPRLRGDATAVARARKDTTAVVSESDVTRRAVEVFGDSVPHAPSPDTASTPDMEATAEVEPETGDVPTWDIDVASYETHARVE